MVKRTPEQQQSFVREAPIVFRPCKGLWGQRGATNVHLVSADRAVAQAGLQMAYDNVRATVKKATGGRRR